MTYTKKLAYLFSLFALMVGLALYESYVNLGYVAYDPLVFTMPGLIVGQLYVCGELIENWLRNRDVVFVNPENWFYPCYYTFCGIFVNPEKLNR